MKCNNKNTINDLSEIYIDEIFDSFLDELNINNKKTEGGGVECESEKTAFILCNNT